MQRRVESYSPALLLAGHVVLLLTSCALRSGRCTRMRSGRCTRMRNPGASCCGCPLCHATQGRKGKH
jgi:hypothetical protein